VDALYRLQGELRLLFAPPPGTLAGFLPGSHLSATLASAIFLSRRATPLGRTIPGVNRRLSVRLPDELAEGIEARVRQTGQTKSEVVRESLKLAGVRVIKRDPAKMAELLQRAAALRASQTKVFDVVALVREGREPMERPESRPGESLRRDRACLGRREPPNGRVTPGFQR